jgi:hypothetical protein
MTRVDWLGLGLKLLGVYFFVEGLGRFIWAVLTIPLTFSQQGEWGVATLMIRTEAFRTLAYAVAYIGAGFVLVFGTTWCVRMIAGRSSELPTESPQMTRSVSAVAGSQELPNWPRG